MSNEESGSTLGETARKETLVCSFCNKSQTDVQKLVVVASAGICDECAETALTAVADETQKIYIISPVGVPKQLIRLGIVKIDLQN